MHVRTEPKNPCVTKQKPLIFYKIHRNISATQKFLHSCLNRKHSSPVATKQCSFIFKCEYIMMNIFPLVLVPLIYGVFCYMTVWSYNMFHDSNCFSFIYDVNIFIFSMWVQFLMVLTLCFVNFTLGNTARWHLNQNEIFLSKQMRRK